MIIWFTGLSGSGKTTLSNLLKEILEKDGFSVCQIDGDVFRKEKKKENKFSREDILENNYEIISYCQTIQKDYDFIIVSVISPYQESRNKARKIFGKEYIEIFLDCSLDVLIKKDVKKIYERALRGGIKNLIGFSPDSPYETPINPDLEIKTDKTSIEESLNLIVNLIKKNRIKIH